MSGERPGFLRGCPADVREQLVALLHNGYRVELRPGGHIGVFHPNGKDLRFFAMTPRRPVRCARNIKTWAARLDSQAPGC